MRLYPLTENNSSDYFTLVLFAVRNCSQPPVNLKDVLKEKIYSLDSQSSASAVLVVLAQTVKVLDFLFEGNFFIQ
jgi:hypothetical protein